MDIPRLMTSPSDPTAIFEAFRGKYATEILTAAVAHFKVFERLSDRPMSFDSFRREFNLAERPTRVLTTALRALGLVGVDGEERFFLTSLARENLTSSSPFDVSPYLALGGKDPGVIEMIERLRTNRPAGGDPDDVGAAFIYKEGLDSAMEDQAAARFLTLSLASRARVVAPVLAERCPLDDARLLVDVAGGSGIYSIAWLQRHPHLRAVIWDRPEVLKVAAEVAHEFGVAGRLDLIPGDMFKDQIPAGADVILLSNVLHDWDAGDCWSIVSRCTNSLRVGGRLLIHDVFLDDDLGGPLPIALYSAALFQMTEGRAYSGAEYRRWLTDAGLVPGEIIPTRVHCGVLPSVKVRD